MPAFIRQVNMEVCAVGAEKSERGGAELLTSFRRIGENAVRSFFSHRRPET